MQLLEDKPYNTEHVGYNDGKNQRNLSELLPYVMLAYRSSVHESHLSPRPVKLPGQIITSTWLRHDSASTRPMNSLSFTGVQSPRFFSLPILRYRGFFWFAFPHGVLFTENLRSTVTLL